MKNTKIKKIIPYCLMFIILVGLFSPLAQVNAEPDPKEIGFCVRNSLAGGYFIQENTMKEKCSDTNWSWVKSKEEANAILLTKLLEGEEKLKAEAATGNTPFEQEINGGCRGYFSWTLGGCLLKLFYYTYFQLPSAILWLAAQFFDVMVDLGIKSSVTSASGFIPEAWTIIRDISNIFFILILLYVAIKTILGLGEHEVKQTIVKVIIIALLINFSMFFTKVIIDSANILALIFYNKLDVEVTRPDGEKRPKDDALQEGKDISGSMWKTFDATRLIDSKTIDRLKSTTIEGKDVKEGNLPVSLSLTIIVIAGSIMLWAAYAFFVAGIMFIGRLIELWILIIFSPFAFMSWTIPSLANTEYLGWDAWFKRLVSTAFMAPIFMFFIYLIFLLLPHIYKTGDIGGVSIFDRGTTTFLGYVLLILIPALIVIMMLLKAVDFAKKGGGRFGEFATKFAKVAVGLGTMVATGGTALAARGLIGGVGGSIVKTAAAGANKVGMRKVASGLTRVGLAAKTSTFDIRNTNFGKFLASKSGVPLGEPIMSITEKRKDKADKIQRQSEQENIGQDEGISKKIRKTELDLQLALNSIVDDFHEIDEELKNLRKQKDDATDPTEKQAFTIKIQKLEDAKTKIENGETVQLPSDVLHGKTITAKKQGGKTIKELKHERDELKMEKTSEERARKVAFAYRSGRWWKVWNGRAGRDAKYNIIMGSKIEDSSSEKKKKNNAPTHAPAPAPAPTHAPAPAHSPAGGNHGGAHP